MSIILRNLAFAIGMLAGVIELRGQGGAADDHRRPRHARP